MTKWQYCLVFVRERDSAVTFYTEKGFDVHAIVAAAGENDQGEACARTIARLGSEGWEAYSVVPVINNQSPGMNLYMKRAIDA